jgi:predicted ester cyclase
MERIMRDDVMSRLTASAVPAILATLAMLLAAGGPVAAEISEDAARASVIPFYEALNAAPERDVAGLLLRATAPTWVSCGTNDACRTRDQAIAAIAGLHKAVPDLKWEIREVLLAGDRVIVRGEATGTPAGDFMGAPHGGKSFKLMSIDVHTIEAGKLARSYHVEDWLGAIRQLTAK